MNVYTAISLPPGSDVTASLSRRRANLHVPREISHTGTPPTCCACVLTSLLGGREVEKNVYN